MADKEHEVQVTEIDSARRPGMHQPVFKRKHAPTLVTVPTAPEPESGEDAGFERTAIGATSRPGLHQPQFTHKGPKAKRVITNFRG